MLNGITALHAAAVSTTIDIEYLVIAGGGSGCRGGGGAGGYRTSTLTGLSKSTNYTVTIGAGGASMNSESGSVGNNGNNSVFF